ncbi:MAG: DUF305 domain-containing protein [Alphaproteobacteria bacterium]
MKGVAIIGAILLLLLGTALLVRARIYSPAALGAQRDLAAANDRMMAGMSGKAVVYLGDPDVDFVNLMIPHHQGAVDMARTELKYGTDPKVRDLASRIEAAQQPQIDQMTHWRLAHPVSPSVDAEAAKQALNLANDHMMKDMHHGPKTGGAPPAAPDRQFLHMMSPHHQGAVDMGEVELKYGKDPEIRALAQAINEAQRREIAEMAKLGGGGHHH